MFKEYVSEQTAKTLIFLLFALTLIVAVVLLVGASASGAGGGELSAAEELDRQQRELAEKLALTSEMEQLEVALVAARRENAAILEENAQITAEKEAAETTRVELLESFGLTHVGEYYATAYCCEEYPHICGGNGVTASGTKPTPGITCAADWSVFPPGTWLYIEGVGMRRVEDSGSAIKGNRLDIAIDTHANALRWGGQGTHHVWVLDGG